MGIINFKSFAWLLAASLLMGTTGTVEAASQGEKLYDLEANQFNPFGPRCTKMERGPDGKIYYNTNFGLIYRVSLDGVAENVAFIVDEVPEDPLSLFTPGITFDSAGNLYSVNAQGIYKVSAGDLATDFTANAPVMAEKIIANPGYFFGLGLTADNSGNLYMVDILAGGIWKFDIQSGTGAPWANNILAGVIDYPELVAPSTLAGELSINLLSSGNPATDAFAGFGLTDIVIDPQNKFLYFGTQETSCIYRLEIKEDGSAGELQLILDMRAEGMGNYALNGISYDVETDTVVVSAPWNNFENGMLAEPKVSVAGGVWTIDVKKLDTLLAKGKSGAKAVKTIIIDPNVGTAVDAIHILGTDGNRRIYVSDGGFEYPGNWPGTADEDGNRAPFGPVETFRLGTGEGSAIRVIEIDDEQ